MKKLFICITIAAFGLAMSACNSAESEQKQILKEAQYGEKGWEYILEKYENSEKFKVVWCEHISHEDITSKHEDRDSPFKRFEGISANYYRLILNEKEYGVYVFFKNGEPRYVCEESETSERYFGVLLLDAWDDRSEREKELERMRFKQGQQWFNQMQIYRRLNGWWP